jgi:hypothetical protein
MAGSRETFYTDRPGIDQGRIEPESIIAPEGDYVLALGSDTVGREVWMKPGDKYDVFQTDSPAVADKLLKFRGYWRGTNKPMPAVSNEVTSPNFFVLANGQTLILNIDNGSNQTITFVTGDFVDITKARAQEVVDVINANIVGGYAINTGRESIAIYSNGRGRRSRVEVVGGTASALNMQEIAWRAALLVGGSLVASRLLRTGEQQDLSDMAANLINFTPPFEIRFRLEVVTI